MKKIINLLYTIIIPVMPLLLHIFIDALTNQSIKLENIYPELFFGTISICIESFRALQLELKYNDTKPLFILVTSLLSIVSSVLYGSILAINNIEYNGINIRAALISAVIIFSSSIITYIAVIVFREA